MSKYLKETIYNIFSVFLLQQLIYFFCQTFIFPWFSWSNLNSSTSFGIIHRDVPSILMIRCTGCNALFSPATISDCVPHTSRYPYRMHQWWSIVTFRDQTCRSWSWWLAHQIAVSNVTVHKRCRKSPTKRKYISLAVDMITLVSLPKSVVFFNCRPSKCGNSVANSVAVVC